MKVIWFTECSEGRLEERFFDDHTKFIKEVRILEFGELKLPSEEYCVLLEGGDTQPCMIIVRSVSDQRLTELFARNTNVPNIISMAGVLHKVPNKS